MTAKKATPAKASSPSAPAKIPAKAIPKGKKGLVVGDTQIMIGGTVYASGSQVPENLIDDEIRAYLVDGEVSGEETETPLNQVDKVNLTADSDRLGTDENVGDLVKAPELDPET